MSPFCIINLDADHVWPMYVLRSGVNQTVLDMRKINDENCFLSMMLDGWKVALKVAEDQFGVYLACQPPKIATAAQVTISVYVMYVPEDPGELIFS